MRPSLIAPSPRSILRPRPSLPIAAQQNVAAWDILTQESNTVNSVFAETPFKPEALAKELLLLRPIAIWPVQETLLKLAAETGG
jgi:hypothetical protein